MHINNFEKLAAAAATAASPEREGEEQKNGGGAKKQSASPNKRNGRSKQSQREYANEGDSDDQITSDRDSDDDDDDFKDLQSMLPLPEGVLQINLGIPIVVVCHKVDLIARGDKAQLLEQNIDLIQKHVRSYCLTYGAAMMFTDIHQQTNLELLYRYLLHRIYDYDFTDKAQIQQKNSIFIPAGFDSLLMIDTLCKGTADEKKVYEEVIKKPASMTNAQSKVKAEILTEDFHSLLGK